MIATQHSSSPFVFCFSVFLTQIIGMCDSLLALLGSGCLWWQVGGGACLCAGPLGFLILAVVQLRKHTSNGTLEYEKSEWPSFAHCREAYREAKCYGKPYAFYDYWSSLKLRGSWCDGNLQGRHWSFFVGDFTRFAWFYCLWLCVRKIAVSAIMTFSNGSFNASLAVGNQFLDSLMLLLLLPYNDMQVTVVEILCGITNGMAYFSIAMPFWGLRLSGFNLGPDLQFLLASCGAYLAGIMTFLSSIIRLIKGVFVWMGWIKTTDSAALNLIAGTGAGGLVAGFLVDEAIGYATSGNQSGTAKDDLKSVISVDTEEVKSDGHKNDNDHLYSQTLSSNQPEHLPQPFIPMPFSSESLLSETDPINTTQTEPETTIFTIILDLPMSAIENDMARFKEEIVHQVSYSLDVEQSKMHVLAVEVGSVVVHMLLSKHVSKTELHRTPLEVVEELNRQAHDSR